MVERIGKERQEKRKREAVEKNAEKQREFLSCILELL
jgi:hypothetical protein